MGPGPNDRAKGLRTRISRVCSGEVGRRVIPCQDHLVRFGSDGGDNLCEPFGTDVVITNASEASPFEDAPLEDVLEIITVFSARLHGGGNHKTWTRLEALQSAAKEITSPRCGRRSTRPFA